MEEVKKDDVDLYAELEKELKNGEESEEGEESSDASDQKPKEEGDDTSKEEKVEEDASDQGDDKNADQDESDELSEEEISKLSPRAQKRIKALAEKVKELVEKPDHQEDAQEEKKPEDKTAPQNFKNVQEFLDAVQDEPSRKLLKAFAHVIQAENKAILDPIEKKNNEARFDSEFSNFEKIEGMAAYKSTLRKTFLRNPNQSLKALVGEVLTDLQLKKVKPIEKGQSDPNRKGKIDLDNLSKEDLYGLLEKGEE